MDYDFITTCNWTKTGTYTLQAYRGSGTDVVTTYYDKIFYRKKGTSEWTALNSSGQMVVDSTGEWEVANNWNKNGNDCLTHSYYGITAIDKCTDVYFNETSLGATIGNYFMYNCWNGCSSLITISGFTMPSGITTVGGSFIRSFCNNCSGLTTMPVGFNLPTNITTIGDHFLASSWFNCTSLTSMPSGFNLPSGITGSVDNYFLEASWYGCTSLTSMPSGFNLPTGITTVGSDFLNACWYGCISLSSMPAGFNIPTGITSVGNYFLNACWYGCTSLKADGYTEDIYFKYAASNAFGGTCPITPDSPTAGSSVAVNRPPEPYVSTQSCTNITSTSVTGNGNIVGIGDSTPTTRGFCYKSGTTGDPTTSDSKVYDTGTFSTGAFTKSITGLTAGTSYRVRAYAVNSAGTGYGTTVTVKTLSEFIPKIIIM